MQKRPYSADVKEDDVKVKERDKRPHFLPAAGFLMHEISAKSVPPTETIENSVKFYSLDLQSIFKKSLTHYEFPDIEESDDKMSAISRGEADFISRCDEEVAKITSQREAPKR